MSSSFGFAKGVHIISFLCILTRQTAYALLFMLAFGISYARLNDWPFSNNAFIDYPIFSKIQFFSEPKHRRRIIIRWNHFANSDVVIIGQQLLHSFLWMQISLYVMRPFSFVIFLFLMFSSNEKIIIDNSNKIYVNNTNPSRLEHFLWK